MKGFATVNMAGRITDKPEVRYRTNGDPVVSFCVAVNRIVKSDFHEQKWTDYIDCINVGESAIEFAKQFKKGDGVEICGRLIQRRGQGPRPFSRLVVDVVSITLIASPSEATEIGGSRYESR